jgi:preprotein translocase subunit YajC
MRRLITVAALAAAFLVPSIASAFHNGEVIVGRYRLPQNHRFESPNAQGKYEVVDINDVPRLIREGRFVFDRTGNAWIAKPGGGPVNAAYLASGSSSTTASSSATNSKEWQQIHGRVGNVSGSTLTLHTDDNRRLTVDMSKVGSDIQKNLQRGDRVTVATHEVTGNNVKAEFIQKDSSAGVQPSASPSASPADEKSWQRIHGKVTSVSGSQLMFKADDGRDLTVDMKDVNPAVQKALTPGEAATVVGFYRGDDKNVAAKFIQQDSSAK